MIENINLRPELVNRTERALDAADQVLDAIESVRETTALNSQTLRDVAEVEKRIHDQSIFEANQRHKLMKLAGRLKPIISDATTVYHIPDEAWDINPGFEETFVTADGYAAMDLRRGLLNLASCLRAIETLIQAEKLASSFEAGQV